MGGDGNTYTTLQSVKYNTTVENTNYNIRNLDLILGIDNITCFDVGAHRIYHAGVDLYRVGSSTSGAEVKAIAAGVIVNLDQNRWPGDVILIKHTPSSKTCSFSKPCYNTPLNKNSFQMCLRTPRSLPTSPQGVVTPANLILA